MPTLTPLLEVLDPVCSLTLACALTLACGDGPLATVVDEATAGLCPSLNGTFPSLAGTYPNVGVALRQLSESSLTLTPVSEA